MCITRQKIFSGATVLLAVFYLCGCASTPGAPAPVSGAAHNLPGIYHTVARGQTLWRISKLYNIDLDELAGINRIPDASSIEPGQTIFIPNRQKPEVAYGPAYGEDFIWPVNGKVIAIFGQSVDNMVNKGINIQAKRGSDVLAARSGRVVFYCSGLKGFGPTLIIDHGDGLLTVYARNAQVFVKAGDVVNKGRLISRVGSYGSDKRPYLHFEIRKSGIAKNPFFYLS